MSTYNNPLDILNDKQVKVYFLGILESNLSSEEKYQKFLAFFAQQAQIERELLRRTEQFPPDSGADLNRILSEVGQEIGVWEPQKMLEETANSLKRAIRRQYVSQHRDGGWGPMPEQSNFWGTAYAVLCLLHARTIKDFTFDVDIAAMLDRGMCWLKEKRYEWDATTVAANGMLSVYHTALAVRCFYQAGQTDFSSIPDCLEALADAQNADGGWDAHLWGPDVTSLTKVYSEVGATSYAIQALAETGDRQYADNVQHAIDWLLAMQNDDGSWNYGSCHSGATKLSGAPDIKKTCEALQGILVGKTYGVRDTTFAAPIDKAVEWLQGQEKPIFDENKRIEGWGWFSSIFDYEVSCLTLETLVKMPDPPLPLLGANVDWLIKSQYTDAGRLENGSWLKGDTARITLSLIEYYKTISASSLFE